jgi:ABC-type antimicrobial peptide transport system permease subunit
MANIKLIFKYAFKDLTKQKVRTILGVIGVTISIGLLAIVLFLSDSIAVTFVDYLSIDAGNQDMVVRVRHYNGEPANRSSYFEYQEIIDQIEAVTDEVDKYIPRMEIDAKVNISKSFKNTELTNFQETGVVSGINFSLENSYSFGEFVIPETTDILDLTGLPINSCAIYYGFNNLIKYAEGETIEVHMSFRHGDKTLSKDINLTIDAIFDYNLKWPGWYRSRGLIVVDVDTIIDAFASDDDFNGKADQLIMTFKDSATIYDSRDLEGSETIVKDIATKIQMAIGLNEYFIDLPKLEILGWSEFITMGITIIFVFVSIIAMLIAGILINGILKTSVEERIREFGIFRVLGAYKTYNLNIVLVQGLLLCFFGTTAGIVLAYFGTEFLIIPAAMEFLLGESSYVSTVLFSGSLSSIIISYVMGMGVGLIVSISPALKVMRLQLIESIHPYRHEDTLYHLQKKSSVNYKLVLVGVILAANGGFIYFVMPRLLISMDMTLMAGTLVAILMIFLIGVTLAGLGLMPLILRLFILIFKPISNRLHNVIKIFVFRYQRRNSSTVMMFALSFSFVVFASTVIQTFSAQIAAMTKMRYGADLVMETTGWETEESLESFFGGGMGMDFDFGGGDGGGGGFFGLTSGGTSYDVGNINTLSIIPMQEQEFNINPNRIITTEFEQELLTIDGIEKVSSVLASPFHLTQVYSDSGKRFSANLADYAGLSSTGVSLYGIDEEYPSTVDAENIVFTRGTFEDAFNETFNNELHYTCIISEGLGISLNLNLGDKIRLAVERGEELENYPFIVVGMASSMPGFSTEFGSSGGGGMFGGGMMMGGMGGGNPGVLISQETYLDLLDIPTPAFLDKIFIKLQKDHLSGGKARIIEDEIDDKWVNNYDYELINLARRVERQQSTFLIIDVLFTLILMATVIICLFGLLSSSYSSIIERKREIGVVRTLGLKGSDINRLFVVEALIIMLSSGTVGVLVGWATGYLLSSNLNLFTDMPYRSAVPFVNIFIVYTISIIFILVGMRMLLRKVRKKKITEIYRETM